MENKAAGTYVLLKTAGKMYKLEYNDLLYAEGNRVFIGKHEIPIGENYKEAFFLLIGSS